MDNTTVDYKNANNAAASTGLVSSTLPRPPTLLAPKVINALPDGVIPINYLFTPLIILIEEAWTELPPDGTTDYIIFWGEVAGGGYFELNTIPVSGPVPRDKFPMELKIPPEFFLSSRVMTLYYRVLNGDLEADVYETSFGTPVIIDRNPPGAGQYLEAAEFVLDPITEYDASNSTTTGVVVPGTYLDRKSMDTIMCAVSNTDTFTGAVVYEQTFAPSTGPMYVNFPMKEIVKFADFPIIYFVYWVRDRAGNISIPSSLPASTHLLLNAPVKNASKPEVDAYESGLLIDREDARNIVSVRVRHYDNWLAGDRCVIWWDGEALAAVTVTTLPFIIPVPWSVLVAKGANLKRLVDVPVRYSILRAGDTVGPGVSSPVKRVTVDMTLSGPDHPEAPAKLNRLLPLVNIFGAASNTANYLDSRDIGKPVRASLTLPANIKTGEVFTFRWAGKLVPTVTYVVKLNDVSGKVIDFDPIDWQVIDAAGSGAAVLAGYETTNQVNQQVSLDQSVFVSIHPQINYPRPSFPLKKQLVNGVFNCGAKVWDGIEVLVAPGTQIRAGDVVLLKWQGYEQYPDVKPIATTSAMFSYTWATNDVSCTFWVKDYEALIRPLKAYAGAAASYTVLRNGIPLGKSAVAYAVIDRRYSTNNYCGKNGIGPQEE